ncbi:GAF domain-containing protein [Chamaesiphon sp.]|uniref:GAF domain-containing protein n=1 Tax=Chamaesiphon sp. TaxID=2814140 RepID=UPI00359386C2
MRTNVVTLMVADFTDISVAIDLLDRHQIRHLPVVDDLNCLMGLVTHESLQYHLTKALNAQVAHLAAENAQLLEQLTTIAIYAGGRSKVTLTALTIFRHGAATEDLLAQAIVGQTEFDTEFRVIHPGSIHFVKAYGLVQRDERDCPCSMTGIDFDITAAKHDDEIELLGKFQVQANLVVPLLNGQMLWGSICIHHCAAHRSDFDGHSDARDGRF